MEAEVDQQLGAEKVSARMAGGGYRSGYRPRRLDTRNGHDVPHGAQGSSGRLHSVLRHRAQAQ